ncbi:MAG: ThuA domain-containing protein [Kiritimatiellales bacterium]|nr:ThuA domain-containing protein [Kiritimatiellales bacterium]
MVFPETARSAYVDFVRKGGGHVVVHAGPSSFPDWEDYQRICLATWHNGTTSHGPRHEFAVRIDDPAHPAMDGMDGFRIADELWNHPGVSPGAKVLASSFSSKDQKGTGAWEPCVLAGQFGEGRCFTILLGHVAGKEESMNTPYFTNLFVRGVEWAAKVR